MLGNIEHRVKYSTILKYSTKDRTKATSRHISELFWHGLPNLVVEGCYTASLGELVKDLPKLRTPQGVTC